MTKTFRNRGALLCALASACVSWAVPSTAQENAVSPPPPLEFPFEAKPEAPRGVSIQFFRAAVEKGADFGLCKALMTKDGAAMPRDAQGKEFCPQEYAKKVADNEGFIQWASNARPLKCAGCVGRPFRSAQDRLDAPNLRRAMLYGNLKFLSATGPNRTITYGFEAFFTCKAENGAREGDLAVDIKFGQPVIGDPGFWESVASFFTAGALSSFIDAKIKENVQNLPSIGSVQGRCRSVGVELGGDPRFDLVKFDPPAEPGRGGRFGAAAVGALQQSATVRLLSVKRLPLPLGVAPEHGRPGDPMTGQFTLFVNGVRNFLPPAGLALPPEGGTAPLNFCKTVEVGGAKTLQILFTNDLGGAVWSQFDRGANFGQGGVRKMTTGRSIVVPGASGLPDPVTGKPSIGKPQTVILREFELTYDIAFNQPRTLSAEPAPPARSGGVNPAVRGAARAPGVAPLAVDPAAPPTQPCRNL